MKQSLINGNKTKGVIWTYLFAFIVFLLLNIFTPFHGDDYRYAFNCLDASPINNFGDVLRSQYTHYMVMNGRAIPHIIEQTFAGITGKWLFNILNSIFFVALIYLVTDRITSGREVSFKSYLNIQMCTFLAGLYLFSYPGQSMLWMAGGLNYLWPTVLALYVLRLFESFRKYNLFLLFVFSFICGWCQEAISIPLTGALWLLIIFDKSYRNRKNVVMASAYMIGTMFIIFAPGTLSRLSGNEVSTSGSLFFLISSKLLYTFTALSKVYIFWIALVLVLYKLCRRRFVFFADSKVDTLLWIVFLMFLLALGFSSERVTLFLSVLSYILVMRSLSIYYDRLEKCVVVLYVLLFFGSVYAVYECYSYYTWNMDMQGQIKKQDSNVVLRMDNYGKKSRFIYPLEIESNSQAFINFYIAKYMGKATVQRFDKDLYDYTFKSDFVNDAIKVTDYNIESNITSSLYYCKDRGLYFFEVPVSEFDAKFMIISYHPVNNDGLTSRQLFVRSILNTLDNGSMTVNNWMVMKDGKCYCFMNLVKKQSNLVTVKENNKMLVRFERNDIE